MMDETDVGDEPSDLCRLSETWSPENLASRLKTFWRNLKKKNAEDYAKRSVDKIPFMILSREVIDMVFCIGRRLNQTTEAQFITVEILDRFIMSEIMAVWKWSRSTDSAKWERAILLVKKQFMLRLLCCMGLASKIEGSPGRVLKPKVLVRYLSTNDRAITIRAVCLSEFHILKLIEYKIPLISSLTYVNALCGLLSAHRTVPASLAQCRASVRLQSMSGKLLRLATANHHRVYDSLAEFARRNSGTAVSDGDLVAARCDRVLLSAGVVALSAVFTSATTADAVSFLLSGEPSPGSKTLDVVLQVAALTGLAHQDVEAAAAVLVHTTGLLDAVLTQETKQPTTAISCKTEVQPSTSQGCTGHARGIDVNRWLDEVARHQNITQREKRHRNCNSPHPCGQGKRRTRGRFVSPDCNQVDSRATGKMDSGIGTSRRTGRNLPYWPDQSTAEGSRSRVHKHTHKGKDLLQKAAHAPPNSY